MSDRVCVTCGDPLFGQKKKYCGGPCSKAAGRDAYLQRRYGITSKQFDELLKFQGGVCAVCKQPPQGRRVLVVDHEHNKGPSGKVRGLICVIPCNLKTVAKHKSPHILQAAADYLREPPAVALFGEIIAPGKPPRKRRPRKRRR